MMRLVSWLIGFSLGAAVGAIVVMLFVPVSSHEVRHRLRSSYQETMEAARLASEQRRREPRQMNGAVHGNPGFSGSVYNTRRRGERWKRRSPRSATAWLVKIAKLSLGSYGSPSAIAPRCCASR